MKKTNYGRVLTIRKEVNYKLQHWSKVDIKYILCIFVAVISVHFMMLLVEGAWWDDWKFLTNDYWAIKEHYIDAGRLDAYYLIMPTAKLSSFYYRLVVLICIFINAGLVYSLGKIIMQNRIEAMLLSILYVSVPVNDIRVMRCIFPYTIAEIFFWLAFYLLLLENMEKKICPKLIYRVFSMLLFFISFTTNSLLVFYAIPIAFLWYMIGKRLWINNEFTIKKFIVKILAYFEFYVIPFVFFVLKKLTFSPAKDGLYSDYNQASIKKMIMAFQIVPNAIDQMRKNVVINWTRVGWSKYVFWAIVVWMIVVWLKKVIDTIKKEKSSVQFSMKCKKGIWGLVVGLVLLIFGMYPYIVIRQNVLETDRDAMLVPIGISVVILSLFNIFQLEDKVKFVISVGIVFCGSMYFSNSYLSYLKAYYEQVALQTAWQDTLDLQEGGLFMYYEDGKTFPSLENCYSLTALGKDMDGQTNRYFSKGISELYFIYGYEHREKMRDDITYCYDQFQLDDLTIKGVVYAKYNFRNIDVLRLKWLEMVDKERFVEENSKRINYKYCAVSKEESDEFMTLYMFALGASDDFFLDKVGGND